MLKKLLLLLASLVVFVVALIVVLVDPFHKNSRAGLQIEYPNGSASVFLDESYLGKAPLTEEKLQSGEHIIKITPDDEQLSNLNLPIFLEKGTLTIIVYNPGDNPRNSSSTVFELRKRNDKSSAVSFETYPENAFISFDNQEVTFSPLTIEAVEPGEHHFIVNLPSYEAQDHSFLVLEGYETKVTINLAKNLKIIEEETKTNEATTSVIQEKLDQNNEASASANEASASTNIENIVE
ncbi:PEGA domain-containing protein [Patescibacteria group bacterium]|nr:PEGA domain-containing protein [Patescibacteria group bacterium]